MPRLRSEPMTGSGSLLPPHLATRGQNAHERADWFRAHGIDPGDVRAVEAIVKASRLEHGLRPVDALDRARMTAEGAAWQPDCPTKPRENEA